MRNIILKYFILATFMTVFGYTIGTLTKVRKSASIDALIKNKEFSRDLQKVVLEQRSSHDAFEEYPHLDIKHLYKKEDREFINNLNSPAERSIANALILSSYSEEVTPEDYDNIINTFRKSIELNPEENFEAANALRAHLYINSKPLLKAGLYMILTSVPGKEAEGAEIAIQEVMEHIEPIEEGEMLQEIDYDRYILPKIAYESAIKVISDQDEIVSITNTA
jgi:hypothetical protein